MSGDVPYTDETVLYALPNEMVPGIDVFGASVVLRVTCQAFSALIVHMQGDGITGTKFELSEQVAKPQAFLTGVRKCLVLRLSAGQRNSGLFLRFPRDRSISYPVGIA